MRPYPHARGTGLEPRPWRICQKEHRQRFLSERCLLVVSAMESQDRCRQNQGSTINPERRNGTSCFGHGCEITDSAPLSFKNPPKNPLWLVPILSLKHNRSEGLREYACSQMAGWYPHCARMRVVGWCGLPDKQGRCCALRSGARSCNSRRVIEKGTALPPE